MIVGTKYLPARDVTFVNRRQNERIQWRIQSSGERRGLFCLPAGLFPSSRLL